MPELKDNTGGSIAIGVRKAKRRRTNSPTSDHSDGSTARTKRRKAKRKSKSKKPSKTNRNDEQAKRQHLLRPAQSQERDERPDDRENIKDVQQIAAALKDEDNGFKQTLWLSGIRSLVKTGDQTACLCQLLYWYGKGADKRQRLRVKREDRFWVAKSYEEFGEEVGLTERQARSALDALVAMGFLEKDHFKFSGKRVCHWRIVPQTLQQALTQLVKE